MVILTKAKHSKGRAGREKGYMGMRRMQDRESRKEKGACGAQTRYDWDNIITSILSLPDKVNPDLGVF